MKKIVLIALLFFNCLGVSAAWYNPSWSYRIKITVNNSKVDADLTNFPVWVNLANLDSTFFDNVQADGDDIRITSSNGTTECPVEMVSINTGSDTGEIHFKAPTLANSTDTDFYIYYGNAGASGYAEDATYGRENVWDSDYTGVYHMGQDPSGSSPQLLDSTSNDHDGISHGSMTSGDVVSGQMGSAIDFDGSNDYFDLGYLMTSGVYTWQSWVYTANASSTDTVMAAEGVIGTLLLWITLGDSKLYHYNDSEVVSYFALSDLVNTTWSKYDIVREGPLTTNGVKGYKGGSAGTPSNSVAFVAPSGEIWIGGRRGAAHYWEGRIDEIRISNTARSATWISTEYNNQSSPSTFYSDAAPETPPEPIDAIFLGDIF